MSGSHILILAIVLIVVFIAPKNLPQLGRSLGDAFRGFKKGISGVDDSEIDVTASAKEKLSQTEAQQTQTTKQSEKDKA